LDRKYTQFSFLATANWELVGCRGLWTGMRAAKLAQTH